jgi:geranylgeranyl reductase family protein
MESCNVLIVGGGPAGSSCAWRLCRAGCDVLILDKKAFPRDKPCAGWITPQVIEALQLEVDEYRGGRVWQPIHGFRSGLVGGEGVSIRYPEPVSYGIRRCEFDTFLLHRAGARLALGESLHSLERVDGTWVVNGRYRAPLVIGAGGHFCPVARRLGARSEVSASVVAAQEVEYEAESEEAAAGIEADMPELYFCRDLKGYGWCFRKGNFLNIGLGRLDAESLSSHVSAFCDSLRDLGKVARPIPTRFKGHAYQLYERIQPKLVDDGILLIGDAAGLAYPQSGEGIRPAVESGLMAAEVILATGGRYGAADLTPYAERIAARFGPPRGRGLSDWLPAAWLHFVAARLLQTRWFSRSVVLEQWFLHRDQPALELAVSE